MSPSMSCSILAVRAGLGHGGKVSLRYILAMPAHLAEGGGADLRPRRVVPVNVPHHAVHVQARVSRQHAAEIAKRVQVPDGNLQRDVAVTRPLRSSRPVSLSW
jgi:hypothetical protein